MADVRLDGDSVLVDATWTKLRSADLWLDHPERRGPGGGEARRALVHDFNDSLAINYVGDYPNGVHIFGKLTVDSLEFKGGDSIAPKELAELRAQVADLESRVRRLESRPGR